VSCNVKSASKLTFVVSLEAYLGHLVRCPFKGIVSPDWKGLQMVSLDRFEV
jgi:hypothetical protein